MSVLSTFAGAHAPFHCATRWRLETSCFSVAVGDDADGALGAIARAYGDKATVIAPNELGRIVEGVLRAARTHARGHYLGYAHRKSPQGCGANGLEASGIPGAGMAVAK